MTKLDTIEIDGLIWTDKHQWSPVAAEESRAATGGLVIEVGLLTKGRPITLESQSSCWVTQAQLDQLHALAATGEAFSLERGTFSAQVMFRYTQAPVIESSLLFARDDTESDQSSEIKYELTSIKLIEV